MKTYHVILADPPWPYNARKISSAKFGQGVHGHYPVLSWEDLRKFPAQNFASPDGCLLFLWATGPHLPKQVSIAESWGFRYSTIAFGWIKTNPNKGDIFKGPGFYTASNLEVVLLFSYGGQTYAPLQKLVPQIIHSPRLRHSAKPPEVQDRIEKMYPLGQFSHIELFARTRRPGWDAMGYEITGELWHP